MVVFYKEIEGEGENEILEFRPKKRKENNFFRDRR